MTIALDTNVLLYAQRKESPLHAAAMAKIQGCVDAARPIAIPWPCVYEFIRVTTHPKVYARPATPDEALTFLRAFLSIPSVVLLAEKHRHMEVLQKLLADSGAKGNHVHDAHIVALMREHGVGEILTEDRDFHRFPGIRVQRVG